MREGIQRVGSSRLLRSSREIISLPATRSDGTSYQTENGARARMLSSSPTCKGGYRTNEARVLRDRNCCSDTQPTKVNTNMNNEAKCFRMTMQKTDGYEISSRKRPSLMMMSGMSSKYRALDERCTGRPNWDRDQSDTSDDDGCAQKCLDSVSYIGYLCQFCGAKCTDKEELRKHLSLRHSGDGFYTCPICSERLPSYFSMFSLEQHMMAHKSGKRFSCSVCHKTFRYERSLRNHMSAHTTVMGAAANTGSIMDSTQGHDAKPPLIIDINCNVAIKEEPPVEPNANTLFHCVGLIPRTFARVDQPQAVCPGAAADVIAESCALRTELLPLGAQHPLIKGRRCQEKTGAAGNCKSCVVVLKDLGGVGRGLRCTKCGAKFHTAHYLHYHIIESLCLNLPNQSN